ncbi:hypothetical protein [Tenuibacillus multivorans]|uniref:hypothetical protein n=1 Tax=Tenuibacillus multivorans TaxID=237069 RepID=UPI0021BEE0AB|nr:hypothetical protein [Tenuibacillus multivorans]
MLTETETFLSKLIQLYTKSRYNHASIALESELTEVYSFGRKKANNPFIGGFVKEDLNTGLFHNAECEIYTFSMTRQQKQQLIWNIRHIQKQNQVYRYNFLGLFGVLFNKPIKRRHAYFCTQFVSSMLQDSHIIAFRKPLSLITPNDLKNCLEFQLVYRGKLKDYINMSINDDQSDQLV